MTTDTSDGFHGMELGLLNHAMLVERTIKHLIFGVAALQQQMGVPGLIYPLAAFLEA